MSTGPLCDYVNYYKPPTGGSTGGGSSSTAGGSSGAGDASSTNILGANILNEKSLEISKDIEENSLTFKCNIKPWTIQVINNKFTMKNPRNVPNAIVSYVSWYNLKYKAFIEHNLLKNSTTQPDLTLPRRITNLDTISDACSESMNKIEIAMPRTDKRFISSIFKKKPWEAQHLVDCNRSLLARVYSVN